MSVIRIYYRKDQEVDEEYTLKTCRIDVKPFECTSHDGESRTRWARSSGFFFKDQYTGSRWPTPVCAVELFSSERISEREANAHKADKSRAKVR